jgi:hygromycin-B 7''-O-kinase
MDNFADLSSFTDLTYYSAHFMDLQLWEPYVRKVCQWHDIQCNRVSPGLPGTFPTFIVEQDSTVEWQNNHSVVVKFYGPPFDGANSFYIERDMGGWLNTQPLPIPSPSILAEGKLEAVWKYLVFEYVAGVSIGQVREKLTKGDLFRVAHLMGESMHCLHTFTSTAHPGHPTAIKPDISTFAIFLENQRTRCVVNHKAWNDLPIHLHEELPSFLLPVVGLIDFSTQPHLIHADLTADHVLGRLENDRWQTLAIIDWGDARTGNILYELVALHLDLFQGDCHLLYDCLEAYDLPNFYRKDFAHKALSMVLLHQFPMPACIYAPHQDARTLSELAERLFGY